MLCGCMHHALVRTLLTSTHIVGKTQKAKLCGDVLWLTSNKKYLHKSVTTVTTLDLTTKGYNNITIIMNPVTITLF